MAFDIFDIRVSVMLEIRRNPEGRTAFLSGIISGIQVQDHRMRVYGSTTYDTEIEDFLKTRHGIAIPTIVSLYNQENRNQMKLDPQSFVGEAQRQSRFGKDWYKGFWQGHQYASKLFYATESEIGDREDAIAYIHEYLKQVLEWMDEALNLRSHLH